VNPTSICSGLSLGGKINNVLEAVSEPTTGHDTFSLSDATDCGGSGVVNLFAGGLLDLGTRGYVVGTAPTSMTFGSKSSIGITADGMKVTITLGKPSGTAGTVANNPGVTFVPNVNLVGADGVAVTGSATDMASKFF
jgi:hypothetical protein